MDTIEVVINDHDLGYFLREQLMEFGEPLARRQGKRYWSNGPDFAGSVGGRTCIISHWVSRRFSNQPMGVFKVHLSQFKNFQQFYCWGQRWLGDAFDEITTSSLRRFDCKVDVPLPLSVLLESAHIPACRIENRYKSGSGCTAYIGSKGKQLIIYGKDIHWKRLDLKIGSQSEYIGQAVRIERRLCWQEIPSHQVTL